MRCAFVLVLAASCVQPHETHPHDDGPHWAYEGHDGPAVWGGISPAFRQCAAGRQQSPIDLDLTAAAHVKLPPLELHYGPARVIEVDNGHTVEDRVPRGEYVVHRDTHYELEQFHFHHPSEHTLDGVRFPLEVHLVHRAATGHLLVIGVLVEDGAEHPALEALFHRLPRVGESVTTNVDPSGLLPDDRHYASYEGSLTTPPCTEGVRWIVLTHPIEASGRQIAQFSARYPHNNRPVMPRHGRDILVDP